MRKASSECENGHKFHSRVVADTMLGTMLVYNWEEYKDQKGYCTGQDDVSRTLINTGSWEIPVSTLASKILADGDRDNIVIDIGSNVGWYSRMAILAGYRVEAYDGNKEHIDLLKENAVGVLARHVWFDEYTSIGATNGVVELMKVDIEGKEKDVFRCFVQAFVEKRIKNLIFEVSPIFNGSYPKLIDDLVECGYEILEIDGSRFNFNFNFDQRDLWARAL